MKNIKSRIGACILAGAMSFSFFSISGCSHKLSSEQQNTLDVVADVLQSKLEELFDDKNMRSSILNAIVEDDDPASIIYDNISDDIFKAIINPYSFY